MLTRRRLGLGGAATAAALLMGERGFAKRYLATSKFPTGLVLLNSNENPDGPPEVSIEAMKTCLHLSGRYRDDDMNALGDELAAIEKIKPQEILIGSGSSEILNCAMTAFSGPKFPVITSAPVFEMPVEIARAMGHPYVQVPLRAADYAADVEALLAASRKADGGLIYICNPNNPTASVTPAKAIDYLVANMPAKAILIIDEAYIHFDPSIESGMKHVRAGKNVIVARTFSKIYGMAGLRVGFGCARTDLIRKMEQFRDNSISLPGVYAASSAINDPDVLPRRRAKFDAVRKDFTAFVEKKGLKYIPSHANFIMFDTGKPVEQVITAMKNQGVAVGRPFPPLNSMLRVTFGTEQEMARCKTALAKVL